MKKPKPHKHWTARSTEDYIASVVFNFTAQLERTMEAANITQTSLAASVGVTEGRVSQVFNSTANLTLASMIKYARGLGLKLAVVAYDDGDSRNERGLVNPEIFVQCWERANKPTDFFELEEGKSPNGNEQPRTQ